MAVAGQGHLAEQGQSTPTQGIYQAGRVVDQSVQGRVSAVAVVAAVAAFAATALAAAIRAIAGKQHHQQASKIVVFQSKKQGFGSLGLPRIVALGLRRGGIVNFGALVQRFWVVRSFLTPLRHQVAR